MSGYICANNTGSLINSLFVVKIFNPFPSFPYLSPSSGGMGGIFSPPFSGGTNQSL